MKAANKRRAARAWKLVLGTVWILLASCAGPRHETVVPAPSVPSAPEVEDVAPVTDGDVTVATVHGVKVVVKRVPHAEFVAGELILKGGVRNWGKKDAGVEELALAVAAHGGTEALPKQAFSGRLSKLGSVLDSGAAADYSTLTAKALKEDWDATFELMMDAFLRPALPPSEIELQRSRQLSSLRHELESPDGLLRLAAHDSLFKGHPYENRAIGTLESVQRLDREQLQAHLAKLRETSRMLFVAVGDVDPAHVFAQVRASLGGLPLGRYVHTPLPRVQRDRPHAVLVDRKLPTDYIESEFFGPGWRDPDFAAALVATEVLSWREFQEVRVKRNLSYAPNAFYFSTSGAPRGILYVTAEDPNTTMKVMLDEVRRLKAEPVPEPELEGDKSTFLTGYLMGNESPAGQGAMLAMAEIYGGDWRLARSLPDRIRAVTAKDVQGVASHILNLQTTYLGKVQGTDVKLLESL